jgi:transposase
MAWTRTEGYGSPLGASVAHGSPKEVSLLSFPLHLSAFTRKPLSRRLPQASASGSLQLVKRLPALLARAQGHSVSEVAARLSRGEHTVRDARPQELCKGMASLVAKAPPGRPSTRPTPHRQQRAEWSKASPHEAGEPSGCWHTPMLQDLIQRHVGVASQPP